jgi:glutamine synthetase
LVGEEYWRRVGEVLREVEGRGLEWVRVAFADQHGLSRCKVVPASNLGSVFENGVAAPISILAKDTSDRTVFPVFSRDAMFGLAETRGAADVILVPDPATFRALPWAPKTGWVLCDLYFPSGESVPFSTRGVYKKVLEKLEGMGYEYRVGLEVEFHVFQVRDARLSPGDVGWPGLAPDVSLLTHGYRLLSEVQWDQIEPSLEELREVLGDVGLRVRSMELEFGPSQVEVTLEAEPGLEAADGMILFRSAAKQVLRRRGLHATFMARPALPNFFSSGWHLHQSLIERETRANAFMARREGDLVSDVGRWFIGGVLEHAREASVFACPTINGYRRYKPLSLAPDRVCWAVDNKGAMLRLVTGGAGDPATRVENRAGEPAANPYLYMMAQLVAGMDGIRRQVEPGPPVEEPYAAGVPLLPRSLEEAVAELERSKLFRDELGDMFVEYIVTLKRAELERFRGEVTEWEQREYFELF